MSKQDPINSVELHNLEETLHKYQKLIKNFDPDFNRHMSTIIEEVVKEVDPVSIYLIGSFSRGEGALRILRSNEIFPMRDYDILIILNKRTKSDVIKRIVDRINRRLGFGYIASKDFKFRGFVVWVTQATLNEINSMPLFKFYELKELKPLWGMDIRPLIQISHKDLLRYNLILILFSKIHGLLGLLKLPVLQRKTNTNEVADLVYECYKTYAEFGTCLSFLVCEYKPTYIERSKFVSQNFDKLFSGLKYDNPNLRYKILEGAYKRLVIDDNFLSDIHTGKLLIETRNDLKIMLNHFVRKAYGVSFTLKELNYLAEEVISKYLQRRFKIRSKILGRLVTELYLRYTLLKFLITARENRYNVRVTTLVTRDANIMVRLWILGLMLLDAVKEDLTIDEKNLRKVISELEKIMDLNSFKYKNVSSQDITFEVLRKILVDLLTLADNIFHRKDY